MANQPGPQIDRIRIYIEEHSAFSETAVSLATKLAIDVRVARRVLEELTEAGEIKRRRFERGIEAVYYRYQARAS